MTTKTTGLIRNALKATRRYTTKSAAEEVAGLALVAAGEAVMKRSFQVTSMRPRRHVYHALELHRPAGA